MSRKSARTKVRPPAVRISAAPDQGLSSAQAAAFAAGGYANKSVAPPTKTTWQILASNLFTYFNLIFFLLSACLIAVGSYRDLMFMPVIIINMVIGIVQELRSKHTLDKLSFLSAPKAKVIRDGAVQTVGTEDTVLDDVVIFASGNQIYADAVVLTGSVQINEALITGESDEVTKKTGDSLLSGSFVVSGECRARLEKVGADAFVSKLTLEAGKMKKRQKSEMMRSLTRLVQCIGAAIIPFGLILLYNQRLVLGLDMQTSVTKTVGALVGMIPEGLYLLTSVALAVSVIRLAEKKTLVHDLGCIETLARVDVLCVDKTGTITEPKMWVDQVIPLLEDRFSREDIGLIMTDYVHNIGAENETMLALLDRFKDSEGRGLPQTAEDRLEFSSALKYSGVSFGGGEAYLLGAPENILGPRYEEYRGRADVAAASGSRVLLLAWYDGDIRETIRSDKVMPLAFITLINKIRADAPATFAYFAKQGVTIKVISGDNPVTVSRIAKDAGIAGAENYVDARTLDTDKKLRAAAGTCAVFGRVTPEQKRKLVLALKADGHKVAMTGDGVNDVLALKSADCGIAMASGSEVACQVSHLVLLDSNFGAMPGVVGEGRRVINNIELAAALFLVKNIFSFLLAVISMIAVLPYPISSAQLSLVSTLTIGVPSFFLALEPNTNLVRGRFLRNVLFRALPCGLANVLLVLGVTLFDIAFKLPEGVLSTISAIILSEVGLIMLYRTCKPFNSLRRLIWWSMAAAIFICVMFFKSLFALSPLDFGSLLILVTLGLAALPVIRSISDILDWLSARLAQWRSSRKKQRLV